VVAASVVDDDDATTTVYSTGGRTLKLDVGNLRGGHGQAQFAGEEDGNLPSAGSSTASRSE
jgi:hypothetical protein